MACKIARAVFVSSCVSTQVTSRLLRCFVIPPLDWCVFGWPGQSWRFHCVCCPQSWSLARTDKESLTSNRLSTPNHYWSTGQVPLCKQTVCSSVCVRVRLCVCAWSLCDLVHTAMRLLVIVCVQTVSSPGLETSNPTRSSSVPKLVAPTCKWRSLLCWRVKSWNSTADWLQSPVLSCLVRHEPDLRWWMHLSLLVWISNF